MLIAAAVAPALRSLEQAYQFIQEYVGFISPGVLVIFLMGFCWKRATSGAALGAALLTIPLSAILKFLPVWTNGYFPDYPFLDRMSIVFVILIAVMIVVSVMDPRSRLQEQKIIIERSMFRCPPSFLAGSVIILGILAALYTAFW